MPTQESMDLWGELQDASIRANERGDCGVRALAVATGLPYEKCRQALAEEGRKARCATYESQLVNAIRALGFRPQFRSPREPITMRRAHEHGRIGVPAVVHCTHHWAGWDGHQVIDWSEGTRKRLFYFIDVFPEENDND